MFAKSFCSIGLVILCILLVINITHIKYKDFIYSFIGLPLGLWPTISSDGSVWIFDCGEGSQVQLQKSPIRPSRITKVFITHLHGDHLFGLPGLMCTIGVMVPERDDFILEIFGPKGLRKFVRNTLNLSRSSLTYDYMVHELVPLVEQYPEDWSSWTTDNEASGCLHPQEKQGKDITANSDLVWNLLDNQQVNVKAGPVTHSIPSFGFVVTERDEPGKLDADRLKQLGVVPGPQYAQIKKGVAITLPSGIILEPSSVLGPAKRGRKVTIVGDSSYSLKLVDIARNSDLVLHEATLENAMEQKAVEMGHSSPRMAAQFAERVNTRRLMLYHFSQRYKAEPTSDTDLCVDVLRKDAEQELATQGCACEVILAEDLLEFSIPRPAS